MSGHSRWSNIKRKKEASDAVKAKIFTKIGREIIVCVKEGGADPNHNAKLRDLIAKAKASNVPNDNIDRVIKKASGEGSKNNYESMVYEGYGVGGVAVIVECLTDNKNRTAADVRHYFDKYGGNMGTTGCVSFLFNEKGILVIDNPPEDEDAAMELCMLCGADDFTLEEEQMVLECEKASLHEVRNALFENGCTILSAEIEMIPSTYTALQDEESVLRMQQLLEHLEDNDDVQRIFHNWENPE